jgi:hypothetical protein
MYGWFGGNCSGSWPWGAKMKKQKYLPRIYADKHAFSRIHFRAFDVPYPR